MKGFVFVILASAATVVGCSSASPTSPSATQPSTALAASPTTSADRPAASPAASGPLTNVTVQLSGPAAGICEPVSAVAPELRWTVSVDNAGPHDLHFVAMAHHNDQAGCNATEDNPRAAFEIHGADSVKAGTRATSETVFNTNRWDCGRVQLDESIFDSTGKELLIIGKVINYGVNCAPPPPPPPPPTCQINCAPPPPPPLLCQRGGAQELPFVPNVRQIFDDNGAPTGVTLTTPTTAASCVEAFQTQTIRITGVGSRRLKGIVTVQFVTDSGRIIAPHGNYVVDQTGDLILTVEIPPVSWWVPHANGTHELHVDVSLELYDGETKMAMIGPGNDWDLYCNTPPPPVCTVN